MKTYAFLTSLLFRSTRTENDIFESLQALQRCSSRLDALELESRKFLEFQCECYEIQATFLAITIDLSSDNFPIPWIDAGFRFDIENTNGLEVFMVDSLLRMKGIYASGELLKLIKYGQLEKQLECRTLGTCLDEVKDRWIEAFKVLEAKRAAAVEKLSKLNASISERAQHSVYVGSLMDQDSVQEKFSKEGTDQQKVAWEINTDELHALAHQKKKLECEIFKYDRLLTDARETL